MVHRAGESTSELIDVFHIALGSLRDPSLSLSFVMTSAALIGTVILVPVTPSELGYGFHRRTKVAAFLLWSDHLIPLNLAEIVPAF